MKETLKAPAKDLVKVRLNSARVAPDKSWDAGQTIELPRHQAQRLLSTGEAVEYVEGEPDFIPPIGSERGTRTLRADASALSPMSAGK